MGKIVKTQYEVYSYACRNYKHKIMCDQMADGRIFPWRITQAAPAFGQCHRVRAVAILQLGAKVRLQGVRGQVWLNLKICTRIPGGIIRDRLDFCERKVISDASSQNCVTISTFSKTILKKFLNPITFD